MFDITETNLAREIESGEVVRDEVLKVLPNLRDQFVGKGNSEVAGQGRWIEQTALEYKSLIVPRIVQDNPRVAVRSRGRMPDAIIRQLLAARQLAGQMLQMSGGQDAVALQALEAIDAELRNGWNLNGHAKGMEHILNRWERETNYKSNLDRVTYDMLEVYGVEQTTMWVKPGYDPCDSESPRWPRSSIIPPDRFVMDPICVHHTEALWKAHWEMRDRDELVRLAKDYPDQGWIKSAIESVPVGNVEDEKNRVSVERNTIKVYEKWIPSYYENDWPGPDEGFHGGLFTFGVGMNQKGDALVGEFIRKPQPCYCPPWGPYVMFGVYEQRGNPYPIGPLAATYSQQCETNAHAKHISMSASEYRRAVVVRADNKQLIRKLKSSDKRLMVIPIETQYMDRDQVIPMEIGGVTDQILQHYSIAKNRLDQSLGLSDAMRSNPKSNVTATADAIADSSSATRVAYIQRKMLDATTQSLSAKAFYFHMDDEIDEPLGPEVAEQLGLINPRYKGGRDEEGNIIPFSSMEFEIDSYSMGRTNEALLQRNVMTAIQMLVGFAPVFQQFPWIDAKDVVTQIGDALNIPGLVDMIDFNQLREASHQMMQQQAMMGGGATGPVSSDGYGRMLQNEGPATAQGRMIGAERQMAGAVR